MLSKKLIFSLLCAGATFLSPISAQEECPATPFSGTAPAHNCNTTCQETTCTDTNIRSYNGTCNNLQNPMWGAAGSIFHRLSPASYDVNNEMLNFANPRMISNLICNQEGDLPDARGLSSFMYSWLQFIDHDITIVAESEEEIEIIVPLGDAYFDPFYTGEVTLPFLRSLPIEIDGVIQHENELTAWIDGSMVYGSDEDRANWLRTFTNGQLKTSFSDTHGELLPFNTTTGQIDAPIDPNAPSMAGNTNRDGGLIVSYVAGDVRAAEQPTLTTLHTVFVREHNRICTELKSAGYTNDEEIYQFARAKVIGIIQSITYNEALPALGLPSFGSSQYNPNLDPTLSHEFSTAAYRLGHSMLPSFIPIVDENCEAAEYSFGDVTATGEISLRDAFFNLEVVWNNGLEGILKGLQTQTQQEIDNFVIDDIRNFLFGAPGSGGLDLATLNIQRGRDHGISDYNTIRESIGLQRFTAFSQITSNVELQEKLAQAYDGNINKIDAWVGMISEDNLPNSSIGESLTKILYDQFKTLRNGDRFWFQNNPILQGHKSEIKNTKLADVLMRNTKVRQMENVFFSTPCHSLPPLPEEYCEGGAHDSSYEHIRKVTFYKDGEQQENASGNDNGFGDYTDVTFDMSGKNRAIFRVFPQSNYNDPRHYKVWVDYNRDGDFNDAHEWVWARYWRRGSAGGRFYFPHDVQAGTYRMRIGMNYGNPWFSACDAYYYGETEDYLITIDPTESGERESGDLASLSDLQPPTGFEEGARVYPNPTTDFVQIALDNREENVDATIVLLNSLGQTTQQSQVTLRAGENVVDMPLRKDIQPGLYFVNVQRDGIRMMSLPLVIVR